MRRTVIITTTTTTYETEAEEWEAARETARQVRAACSEPPQPPPPPPWIYPRQHPERTPRPKGCRCLKRVFLRDGCDGVHCRRKWTSTIPDAITGWEQLVNGAYRQSVARSVWGLFGQVIQFHQRRGRELQ